MRKATCCLVTLLIACALPFGLVEGRPEGLEEAQPVPTLSVRGEGQVGAAPDQAVIRLGAVAEAKEADSAQQLVNRIMGDVMSAIGALQIPEGKLTTVGLSLWPVYADRRLEGSEQYKRPEIVAYRASNVTRFVVSDLNLVGEVIDAGVSAGANQVESISFELRDDIPYRKEALRLAVKSAQTKARAIAEAVGSRLVSVVEISEGGVNLLHPRMRSAMISADTEASTPVRPGEIQVKASVTIRYVIDATRMN